MVRHCNLAVIATWIETSWNPNVNVVATYSIFRILGQVVRCNCNSNFWPFCPLTLFRLFHTEWDLAQAAPWPDGHFHQWIVRLCPLCPTCNRTKCGGSFCVTSARSGVTVTDEERSILTSTWNSGQRSVEYRLPSGVPMQVDFGAKDRGDGLASKSLLTGSWVGSVDIILLLVYIYNIYNVHTHTYI